MGDGPADGKGEPHPNDIHRPHQHRRDESHQADEAGDEQRYGGRRRGFESPVQNHGDDRAETDQQQRKDSQLFPRRIPIDVDECHDVSCRPSREFVSLKQAQCPARFQIGGFEIERNGPVLFEPDWEDGQRLADDERIGPRFEPPTLRTGRSRQVTA